MDLGGPRKGFVSEGSSLCLRNWSPRNTRKDAKKLRVPPRGREGHGGNIKVVRTRPTPNFTLSLKIIFCDLRDLCVSLSLRLLLARPGSEKEEGHRRPRRPIRKRLARRPRWARRKF